MNRPLYKYTYKYTYQYKYKYTMFAHATPSFVLTPAAGHEDVVELYPAGLQENPRRDSGVDLPTPAAVTIPAHGVVRVNLGVRAVCRIEGGEGVVYAPYRLVPRSSIAKTPLMLANGEGIIDLGYRGPLIAAVRNLSDEPYTIARGQALFQLVAADLAPPVYELLTAEDPRIPYLFDETLRGAAGFGSTGAAGSAAHRQA